MAYRSVELAARERIDQLEEELMEAEAELQRQAEEIQSVGLRMREQIRLQRSEQTLKTRALTLEAPEAALKRRRLAAIALLIGMVIGVVIPTLVVLSVASLMERADTAVAPLSADARLCDFTYSAVEATEWHAAPATPQRADQEAGEHGELRIDCSPACESIRVDGLSIGRSPAALMLDPGAHRVTLQRNRLRKTIVAQISSGQVNTQRVSMK